MTHSTPCHSAHRITVGGGTGLQIFVDTPCLRGLRRGCPGSLSGWLGWAWHGPAKLCNDHSIADLVRKDGVFARRRLIHRSGSAMVLPQSSFCAHRCWLRASHAGRQLRKITAVAHFSRLVADLCSGGIPEGPRTDVVCSASAAKSLGGGTRGVGQQAVCGARWDGLDATVARSGTSGRQRPRISLCP